MDLWHHRMIERLMELWYINRRKHPTLVVTSEYVDHTKLVNLAVTPEK